MSKKDNEALELRIKELEREVVEREQDLLTFRRELAEANKKLEGLIEKLHFEVKAAQAIQKVLVPTEIPNIPGIEFSYKFIPSMVSGGDYFDIFEHDDKYRFGLLLASGRGHSISALLLSVLLHLSGKMEAKKGAPPHKVIQMIKNELAEGMSASDEADLLYAVVDRRSFEMTYCGLGPITALYQEQESGHLRPLVVSDEPLSLKAQIPGKSNNLLLNPRDRIILCSRGVIDTQNLEGEKFGRERLFNCILSAPKRGVHELRNEILLQIKKFAGGGEPVRDQSVVIAEVKDRVIKLAKN